MGILALVLANLPAIVKGGTAVIDFISQVRAAAHQSGEWDTAHEAAFQQLLANAGALPESQPDAPSASNVS